MKTIVFLFSALLFLQQATANDEIKFESAQSTWAQVKEKAKRENKMIFFDAMPPGAAPVNTWRNPFIPTRT
jgi:hypothetical protein